MADEFADIDVARLFDGVSDGPSDGLGRDRDIAKFFISLQPASSEILLASSEWVTPGQITVTRI
jgi:hypothetical protein